MVQILPGVNIFQNGGNYSGTKFSGIHNYTEFIIFYFDKSRFRILKWYRMNFKTKFWLEFKVDLESLTDLKWTLKQSFDYNS